MMVFVLLPALVVRGALPSPGSSDEIVVHGASDKPTVPGALRSSDEIIVHGASDKTVPGALPSPRSSDEILVHGSSDKPTVPGALPSPRSSDEILVHGSSDNNDRVGLETTKYTHKTVWHCFMCFCRFPLV